MLAGAVLLAAPAARAADRTVAPEQFGAGARFDQRTDDTTAVQAAADALQRSGGGTLLLNRRYNLASAQPRGDTWVSLSLWGDDLVVRGAPGAALVATAKAPQYRPFFACGGGKLSNPDAYATRTVDVPVQAIVGSVAKGATAVRLADREAAAAYRPGDIAYLRTGQLIERSVTEPDAELLEVASADPATGVVRFTRPTSKPYRQEYFERGEQGISSTAKTKAPTKLGLANVSDRIMRNLRLENLVIEAEPALQAQSVWAIWGLQMKGGEIRFGQHGTGSRDVAWATVEDVKWIHTGRVSRGSWFLAPSTGCTHWKCRDLTARSEGYAYLHLHEGLADVSISGLDIELAGAPDANNAAIDIRGRSYDLALDDYQVSTGRSTQPALLADAWSPNGGRIGRGRINSNARFSAVRMDAAGWAVTEPAFAGSNRVVKAAGR